MGRVKIKEEPQEEAAPLPAVKEAVKAALGCVFVFVRAISGGGIRIRIRIRGSISRDCLSGAGAGQLF